MCIGNPTDVPVAQAILVNCQLLVEEASHQRESVTVSCWMGVMLSIFATTCGLQVQ